MNNGTIRFFLSILLLFSTFAHAAEKKEKEQAPSLEQAAKVIRDSTNPLLKPLQKTLEQLGKEAADSTEKSAEVDLMQLHRQKLMPLEIPDSGDVILPLPYPAQQTSNIVSMIASLDTESAPSSKEGLSSVESEAAHFIQQEAQTALDNDARASALLGIAIGSSVLYWIYKINPWGVYQSSRRKLTGVDFSAVGNAVKSIAAPLTVAALCIVLHKNRHALERS